MLNHRRRHERILKRKKRDEVLRAEQVADRLDWLARYATALERNLTEEQIDAAVREANGEPNPRIERLLDRWPFTQSI